MRADQKLQDRAISVSRSFANPLPYMPEMKTLLDNQHTIYVAYTNENVASAMSDNIAP
jgi:hypothetical protein